MELLSWPHHTTEAGVPKVKYDSADPDRIGTLVGDADSTYLATGDEDSPTMTAPVDGAPATPTTTLNPNVVLDLASPASEIAQDISLRILHLITLGAWVIPVGAATLGRRHPASVPVALIGMAGTAITSGHPLIGILPPHRSTQ